jgi:hypothetical protein
VDQVFTLPFDLIFQYCYDFSNGPSLKSVILGPQPQYKSLPQILYGKQRTALTPFTDLDNLYENSYHYFTSGGTESERPKEIIGELLNFYYNYLLQRYTDHFIRLNSTTVRNYTKMGIICLFTGSIQLHLSSIELFLRIFKKKLPNYRSGDKFIEFEDLQSLLIGTELIIRAMKHVESICITNKGKKTRSERNPAVVFYLEHYLLSSSSLVLYENWDRPALDFFRGHYWLSPSMIDFYLITNPGERKALITSFKLYRDTCYDSDTFEEYSQYTKRVCSDLIYIYRQLKLTANNEVMTTEKLRNEINNAVQPISSSVALIEFLLYSCFPALFHSRPKTDRSLYQLFNDKLHCLIEKNYFDLSFSSLSLTSIFSQYLEIFLRLFIRCCEESGKKIPNFWPVDPLGTGKLFLECATYEFPDLKLFQEMPLSGQQNVYKKLRKFVAKEEFHPRTDSAQRL